MDAPIEKYTKEVFLKDFQNYSIGYPEWHRLFLKAFSISIIAPLCVQNNIPVDELIIALQKMKFSEYFEEKILDSWTASGAVHIYYDLKKPEAATRKKLLEDFSRFMPALPKIAPFEKVKQFLEDVDFMLKNNIYTHYALCGLFHQEMAGAPQGIQNLQKLFSTYHPKTVTDAQIEYLFKAVQNEHLAVRGRKHPQTEICELFYRKCEEQLDNIELESTDNTLNVAGIDRVT